MHSGRGSLMRGAFGSLLLAGALLLPAGPSVAFVTVGVSITVAPPALPVYTQPPIPGPGYLWAPGYWAWGPVGYYWVPGTWVLAPQPGLLWTPGYWGWVGGVYVWHAGYWGPRVGFYGGVNYGFGYVGVGYAGGYWERGEFRYNSACNNIGAGVHITNVYNTVVVNNNVTRVSYNGGAGGIQAQATAAELAAGQDHHVPAVAEQMHHEQLASSNPQLQAGVNHGVPPIAATRRVAVFSGAGVNPAHGYNPANTPGNPPVGGPQPKLQHGGGGGGGAPHEPREHHGGHEGQQRY